MAIKDKTLSYPAAFLLDKINEQNKKYFTIDEAYSLLSHTAKDNVKRMLSNMTKRGLLMRIKEGHYYIIPFEQDPKTFMPDYLNYFRRTFFISIIQRVRNVKIYIHK